MFVIESSKYCPVCHSVTHHSHKRFSIARTIAVVLAIVGGWMLFRSTPEVVAGIVLLFIALALVLFERERMARIECDRCRSRAVAVLAKTKPDLKNTEINVM